MTSATPPPENDDAILLASLYLDGEATAEEVAIVESDQALMALVDDFRQTQQALSERVTPPVGLQRRQIDAALAEASWLGPAGDAAVVSDLGRARAERADRRAIPAWLGAAAAAVVAVAGIGFLLSSISTDDDDSSDTASDEFATREASEASSVPADELGDATRTTGADDIESDDAMEEEAAADATSALGAGDSGAEEAEMAAEDDAAEEEATEEADDEGGETVSTPVAVGDLANRTALEVADSVPPEAFSPFTESLCLEVLAPDSPIQLDDDTSFALIELVDGSSGQVVVDRSDRNGSETALVLDDTCAVILD